ncbi:hypothetical protein OG292_07120 [Streptomyces sp. NBC_01511]|uniref:SCO4225 family membrane protein n=1 Tax=Streptomyces sp. NBC_01511 TaxID=2903889 RepID=UPI003866F9C1
MSTARGESTTMTDTTASHRALRAVRRTFAGVYVRVYLAVCVALLGWSVVVSTGPNEDASFAGVVPLMATAPLSLIVIVLPDHVSMFYLSVGVGALANAVPIAWCARVLSRALDRSRPTA